MVLQVSIVAKRLGTVEEALCVSRNAPKRESDRLARNATTRMAT